MGFRIYMFSYPKKIMQRFEMCSTVEDVAKVCKDYGLGDAHEVKDDIEDGCAPAVYRYGDLIFGFGSGSSPFDHCFGEENRDIFKSPELANIYRENLFFKLTAEDFRNAIEWCANEIREGYADLLREKSEDPFLSDIPHIDRLKEHIQQKITEWDNSICSPYHLEQGEPITGRWPYEFAIWELIRKYRDFDWDKNELCLCGW